MKSYPRSERIGDQIQRELAELIRLEVRDPRVGLATITGVQVSSDLKHAEVFVSVLADGAATAKSEGHAQTLEGLNRAAGFLRAELSHRMQLRSVPQLKFVFDASVQEGVRLTHLIDDAVAEDQRRSRS